LECSLLPFYPSGPTNQFCNLVVVFHSCCTPPNSSLISSHLF
jgi:hypothetical protein